MKLSSNVTEVERWFDRDRDVVVVVRRGLLLCSGMMLDVVGRGLLLLPLLCRVVRICSGVGCRYDLGVVTTRGGCTCTILLSSSNGVYIIISKRQ